MIARARKLAQSDYGREFGWYIEHEGDIIGELSDPIWEGMFWDSYKLTASSSVGERVLLDPSMWNECRFRYRNMVLGEYAANAYPGGTTVESLAIRRIAMRALYLRPRGVVERLGVAIVTRCPRGASRRQSHCPV